MKLRPYQHEALHGGRGYPGIFRALEEKGSTILVLPTGAGKTIVFSRVVEHYVELGKRALVVAHRRELIDQAYDKIIKTTSVGRWDVGVEMAGDRAADHHKVVVGSVQTLTERRLAKFNPAEFGLVIVDEAHHGVAQSYQRIYHHFRTGEDGGAKLLGVTATPDRLDGTALGEVFSSVAYSYGIDEAIDDGFLVPIKARIFYDAELDFSKVRRTAGDFNKGDLAKVMESEIALSLIARGVHDWAGDRQTIIFAASVEQAYALAEILNSLDPHSALAIDGTASVEERREALRWLQAKPGRRLVNCLLFTEGLDVPEVSCVVPRPTQSRALYAQMAGRGTRLLGSTLEESAAAGKEDMLILDFCGATGKHQLVNVFDILGGKEAKPSSKVFERAEEKAKEGQVGIREALEQARREIDQEELEEQRRLAMEVRYQTAEVHDVFGRLGVKRPVAGSDKGPPATEKQIALLQRHSIPEADKLSRRQASKLIDAIVKRIDKKRCSVKQGNLLQRYGLNADASFQSASAAITAISNVGWKPAPRLLENLIARYPDLSTTSSEIAA